jgi:hypothetical protein
MTVSEDDIQTNGKKSQEEMKKKVSTHAYGACSSFEDGP